jgi:ElaA protein
MEIIWNYYNFAELSPTLLYEILALRQKVFILEQNCIYLDTDGYDQSATHCCGVDDKGTLIAYSRIIPPKVKYTEPSIGRVVVAQSARRNGIGYELMKKSIEQCNILYPQYSIRISAQLYLEQFYSDLGFNPVGTPYLEDDIPHIEMLRQ